MLRKILSAILSVSVIGSCSVFFTGNNDPFCLSVSAKEKGPADYTYTITPLLTPFNEYFFVKTDNPDPKSFRFADKSSKYSDDANISFDYDDFDDEITLYADIKYDDPKTGRVNGGYIFTSYNTDGGEIVLQSRDDDYDSWNVTWSDTNVRLVLPALKDEADYLIDTYATKTSFFDNMDAVQEGLSSICHYSGSYIRGKIIKTDDYWFVATAGHIDQSLYIYSPYEREGTQSLFASAIYTFRHDSLGFPGMMAEISERLDKSSSYTGNSFSHWLVDVTYNGETRSYGGNGDIHGKGIDKEDILQYFSFGTNGTKFTLESIDKLLKDYASLNIEDNIPREDSLTWEKIYDRIGEGAWIRMSNTHTKVSGKWVLGSQSYTYLYRQGYGDYLNYDEWGVGYSQYLDGDLGYLCDAWVDGRYIGKWRYFVPGEKFEDHPTSSVLLDSVKVPQLTYDYSYRYNYDTDEYEEVYTNIRVEEKIKKNVLFEYDGGIWKASYSAFDNNCANYFGVAELAEKGLIDKKYLDMVTLTEEEVRALKVDRKTNITPKTGYIYDGIDAPGTPYTLVPLTSKDIKVKLSATVFSADDKVHVPKVTVTHSGKTLTEGRDYYLIYSDEYSKEPGEYTVTVGSMGNYSGKLKRSYRIAVPADSIKLGAKTASVSIGGRISFKALTVPAAAADGIVWTSSDKKIATVSDGIVKGISKGTVLIKARTANGKVAACRVAVGKPLTNESTLSSTKIYTGRGVTVRCSADGGTSPYTYSVIYRRAGYSKWKTAQSFNSNNSVKLTFGKAGDYEIKVKAKDAKGAVVSRILKLSVSQPLTNTSVLSAGAVVSGGRVKIRGFAKGGSGGYQYSFYYKKAKGSKWVKLRDYRKENLIYFSPKTSSDYIIRVYVKDSSGKKAVKQLSLKVVG